MQAQFPITVPFCYLPNSRTQTFTSKEKVSLFQAQTLKEISENPEFAYFVVTGFDAATRIVPYPNDALVIGAMYYTKDGSCNYLRIGQKAILQVADPLPGEPIPLDHCVYVSRTK